MRATGLWWCCKLYIPVEIQIGRDDGIGIDRWCVRMIDNNDQPNISLLERTETKNSNQEDIVWNRYVC